MIFELSQRRSPGEPVFAHGATELAVAYYGPRFGVTEGISFGGDLPSDLSMLFGFRGEPSLWVVFSNASTRDFILCYLDEIGRETERLVRAVARIRRLLSQRDGGPPNLPPPLRPERSDAVGLA